MLSNTNQILIVLFLMLLSGFGYVLWSSLPQGALLSGQAEETEISTITRLVLLEQEMAELRERYEQMSLDLKQQVRLQHSIMDYVKRLNYVEKLDSELKAKTLKEPKLNSKAIPNL